MTKLDTKRIILVVMAIGVIFFLLGCGETRSNRWSVTKEIKAGTAGGWLIIEPPAAARDITLIYNIDTNEIWEFFRIDGKDGMNLPHGCVEIADTDAKFPRQPRRHVVFPISGWPEGLTHGSKSRIEGIRLFRCPEEPPYPAWKGPNYYHLAIDKGSSRVYAWNNDGG
jgi:hypothetical protein